MITSKQIINIGEEWFKRVHFDIYKNPTSSDYIELYKNKVYEIRFAIDSHTKEVFISDANKTLHYQMMIDIGGATYNNFQSRDYAQLLGVAVISGGKSKMTESDTLALGVKEFLPFQQTWLKKIFTCDWSWADRYIEVTSYLEEFKQRNSNILKEIL